MSSRQNIAHPNIALTCTDESSAGIAAFRRNLDGLVDGVKGKLNSLSPAVSQRLERFADSMGTHLDQILNKHANTMSKGRWSPKLDLEIEQVRLLAQAYKELDTASTAAAMKIVSNQMNLGRQVSFLGNPLSAAIAGIGPAPASLSDFKQDYGNSQRQRILEHATRYQRQDDVLNDAKDYAIAKKRDRVFSAMEGFERQWENIEHNNQQQELINKYNRDPVNSVDRRTERLNRRLKGITADDDFPSGRMSEEEYSQSRMDWKRVKNDPLFRRKFSTGASGFNSHNFRFASQNLGFGIDDAIQSYHYGGIGASVRAASNNLTAIAGMGISNPAVAAGTVVALSIATAALPVILRRMGVDEEVIKAQYKSASVAYSGDGSITGSVRRRSAGMSGFSREVDAAYSLLDADRASGLNASAAMKVAQSYLSKDEIDAYLEKGQLGTKAGTVHPELNRALDMLKEDKLGSPERQGRLNLQREKVDYLLRNAPEIFGAQERSTARNREFGFSRYRAETIEQYESILRSEYAADMKDIKANPHTSQEEKNLAMQQRAGQYQSDLSQKSGNARSVLENTINRRQYMASEIHNNISAYSMENISGARQGQALWLAYAAKHNGYELDQKLDPFERNELQTSAKRGFEKDRADLARTTGRAFADELRSNLGINSSLEAMTVGYNRRNEDYLSDPMLDADKKAALVRANDQGFGDNRRRLIEDMVNNNKVTNPLGNLADRYVRSIDDLQREFATGNYTAEEQATLSKNIKHKFAADLREINTPAGHERFAAESSAVGSAHDREMESRMLGRFVGPQKDQDLQEKTLVELQKMAVDLSTVAEKAELLRLFGK